MTDPSLPARLDRLAQKWGDAPQEHNLANTLLEAAAELRARDAAPIVGEREAFEAWASDNIDRLIAAHLGVDETTQFGKRIAASFLCAAAWNARAALPSGGGAREAAEEIAEAVLDMDKSGHDNGVLLVTKITAILSAHIPSAPAGLTSEEQADIALLDRWREQLSASWYQQPLLKRLSATLHRLTGGQKS